MFSTDTIMRLDTLHIANELYRGKSLARTVMNLALRSYVLQGRVVDVGGGRSPDYFSYLDTTEETSREVLDASITGINFETDQLPFRDGEVDTVLMCNVLEHIYNYQFLLKEIHRVIRPNGSLLGFVPFWVGYHPDPHDYFRYTKEALVRMFKDAGYDSWEVVPLGVTPIMANVNTLVLSLPRPLRPILYICCLLGEWLMQKMRPACVERYPLGYIFTARRHA